MAWANLKEDLQEEFSLYETCIWLDDVGSIRGKKYIHLPHKQKSYNTIVRKCLICDEPYKTKGSRKGYCHTCKKKVRSVCSQIQKAHKVVSPNKRKGYVQLDAHTLKDFINNKSKLRRHLSKIKSQKFNYTIKGRSIHADGWFR